MGIINGMGHIEKRKLLRKQQTPEEAFVWKMLRRNKTGMKWRRQVSIGPYVADFYCGTKKLVLELDGSQHFTEKAVEYDQIRTCFFETIGIKVIRISNTELNRDPAIIYERIEKIQSLV